MRKVNFSLILIILYLFLGNFFIENIFAENGSIQNTENGNQNSETEVNLDREDRSNDNNENLDQGQEDGDESQKEENNNESGEDQESSGEESENENSEQEESNNENQDENSDEESGEQNESSEQTEGQESEENGEISGDEVSDLEESGNNQNTEEGNIEIPDFLKIISIFPNPEGRDKKSEEFLEIENLSEEKISLFGFCVEDLVGSASKFCFSEEDEIEAQGSKKFYGLFSLNNEKDEGIRLFYNEEILEEIIIIGGEDSENEGKIYTRKEDDIWEWVSQDSKNSYEYEGENEEDGNQEEEQEEEIVESEAQDEESNEGVKIVINEIAPSTDPEMIELFSLEEAEINLNGFYIEDDSSIIFEFSEDAFINADSFLSIEIEGTKLRNTGELIKLFSDKGNLLDQVEYPDMSSESKKQKSFARRPVDGTGDFYVSEPTFGSENPKNNSPVAIIRIQGSGKYSGKIPFRPNFTAEDSYDPDGDELKFYWDFGNGQYSSKENPILGDAVYQSTGSYNVNLEVTDSFGFSGSSYVEISTYNASGGSNFSPKENTCNKGSDANFEIKCIYPNPENDENKNEFIEIKSLSGKKSACGFIISDLKKEYEIDFSKSFYENKFFRSSTKIALNNTGIEKVFLKNYNGEVVDSVSFRSKKGRALCKENGVWKWEGEDEELDQEVLENELEEKQEEELEEKRPKTIPNSGYFLDTFSAEIINCEDAKYCFGENCKPGNKYKEAIEIKESSKLQFSCGGEIFEEDFIFFSGKDLKITEIFPNPEDENQEFIELQNRGEEQINLKGFSITDGSKTGKFIIQDEANLLPKDFFVLKREDTKIALNNDGDEILLFDPAGNKIEEIKYEGSEEGQSLNFDDSGFYKSIPTPGEKNLDLRFILKYLNAEEFFPEISDKFSERFLGLNLFEDQNFSGPFLFIKKNKDSEEVLAFSLEDKKNLNEELLKQGKAIFQESENLCDFLNCEEFKNAEFQAKKNKIGIWNFENLELKINEVFSNPKGRDEGKEFIEIINLGNSEVNLFGWEVINDPSNSKPFIFQNQKIKSGEILLIKAEEIPFSVRNSNEKIILLNPINEEVDSVSFEKSEEGKSLSLDEYGAYKWTKFPTPGYENIIFCEAQDSDNDGICDEKEIALNLDPFNPDSDKDLIPDLFDKNPKIFDLDNSYYKEKLSQISYFEYQIEGEKIKVFGQTVPNSKVKIFVHSDLHIIEASSDENGNFETEVLKDLKKGKHSIYLQFTDFLGNDSQTTGTKSLFLDKNIKLKNYSDKIKIYRVLPNPIGKDEEGEWIEIKNLGDESVNLKDWVIESKSKKYTLEDMQIPPLGTLIIPRKESKISLNNSGEALKLLDPYGRAKQEFSYGNSIEGVAMKNGDSFFKAKKSTSNQSIFSSKTFWKKFFKIISLDSEELVSLFSDKYSNLMLLSFEGKIVYFSEKGAFFEFKTDSGKKILVSINNEKFSTEFLKNLLKQNSNLKIYGLKLPEGFFSLENIEIKNEYLSANKLDPNLILKAGTTMTFVLLLLIFPFIFTSKKSLKLKRNL